MADFVEEIERLSNMNYCSKCHFYFSKYKKNKKENIIYLVCPKCNEIQGAKSFTEQIGGI